MLATTEKRVVKVGIDQLPKEMTKSQAMIYGDRNMPDDLRAAGFKVDVFTTDAEIHGGLWFRVSYGK